VKGREDLRNRVSNIIRSYIDHMKFAAYIEFSFIIFFFIFFGSIFYHCIYGFTGESNGKLTLRTFPGCSVPEPYQSPD
jgi:hypothetical protein